MGSDPASFSPNLFSSSINVNGQNPLKILTMGLQENLASFSRLLMI